MLDNYREKLFSLQNEWFSIGVTKDGKGVSTIPVPWEITANAFNMKTPDIYISTADVSDTEIIDQICKNRVVGCYVFDELDDYSFISRLTGLWDVHIEQGSSIRDLSFLSDLTELKMLYLENVTLDSMDDLYSKYTPSPFGVNLCLGLFNCDIKDVSVFEKYNICLNELVVFATKDLMDKQKWKNTKVLRKNYYEPVKKL